MLHEGTGIKAPRLRLHAKFRAWWQVSRCKLSVIFTMSFFFHILILGILFSLQSSSSLRSGEITHNNEAAIQRALAEVSSERRATNGKYVIEQDKTNNANSDFVMLLGRIFRFDRSLNEKDKVEIYKRLLEAILQQQEKEGGAHLDLASLTSNDILNMFYKDGDLRLNSGDKAIISSGRGLENGITVHKLDSLDELQINRFRQYESLQKEAAQKFGDFVKVEPKYQGYTFDSVPQEYYFRECPYKKILAQGASIFIIIRGFPAIGSIREKSISNQITETKQKSNWPPFEKGKFIVYLLKYTEPTSLYSKGTGRNKPAAVPALKMTDAQFQFWLDGLMALPERTQFIAFRDRFLRLYDADDVELARFASKFVSANLNSVFFMLDDFTLTFDSIEELYYKQWIYEQFASYWLANPQTRTADEFLFSLAAAYDFEKRILANLFRIKEETKAILSNRKGNPNVFNPKAKAFVLSEIRTDVENSLRRLGIPSVEDALRRYVEAEIAIYQTIADSNRSNRDRALFTLGQIYWEEKRLKDAFDVWRQIAPTFGNSTFKKIQTFLTRPSETIREIAPRISAVFEEDNSSGSLDLLRRRRQFHKWLNRIERIMGISR